MMNTAGTQVKTMKDICEMVKGITILDAICNTYVAWHAIKPETVVKCFNRSGVYDFSQDQPEIEPHQETLDDDPEFAKFFEELLHVAWDECLDDEDELNYSARAPDSRA